MNSGTGLVETWIPDGGFEIQRRNVTTPDRGTVATDCLVPKWSGDDLTADRPYTASRSYTVSSPRPSGRSTIRALTGFRSPYPIAIHR